MKKTGAIKRWDAAKGFGFIRSQDVSADVFFHVKVFRSSADTAPHEGMQVSFEEIYVGGKGPKATIVNPLFDTVSVPRLGQAAKPSGSYASGRAYHAQEALRMAAKGRSPARASSTGAPPNRLALFLASLAVWAALMVFGLVSRRLAIATLAAFVVLNIATIFVYAFDKNAAEHGSRRTREDTLHFFALAGGWPAAWLAQQVMRHKTSKTSFQTVYWATVWLHCAGLAAWIFWLYAKISAVYVPAVLR